MASAPAVMVYSVIATPISEFVVALTAGTRVTFRTTDIVDTEDPVLHLFSSSGTQVAMADDGGGGQASFLAYTPSTSGSYRLMVRSRTPAAFGLADILKHAVPWKSDVPFAGAQVSMPDIRQGEQLQTTVVTGGVDGPHRLYVLGGDGLSVIARNIGDGPNSGARLTSLAAASSRTMLVGSPPDIPGGRVRLTRNDVGLAGHDADGDGLGTELEVKIGTCTIRAGTRWGFNCGLIADAADSDGDGIVDGWEYFGRPVLRRTGPFQFDLDYLTLPEWGANPRHKDLFVEVDFMMRCPEDTAPENDAGAGARFRQLLPGRGGESVARQAGGARGRPSAILTASPASRSTSTRASTPLSRRTSPCTATGAATPRCRGRPTVWGRTTPPRGRLTCRRPAGESFATPWSSSGTVRARHRTPTPSRGPWTTLSFSPTSPDMRWG